MITDVDILGDRSWSYAFAATRRSVVKAITVHQDGRLLDHDVPIFPRVTFDFPLDEQVVEVWEGNSRPIQAKGLNTDSITWDRIQPQINYSLLGRLLDPVVGSIRVDIVNEESQEVIFTKTQPLTLLARNEWVSRSAGNDLLAAFVLPSDPYVSEILSTAREILQRDTGTSSTEGYQSERLPAPGDNTPLQLRSRAHAIARAIYDAMCTMGYSYSNPQGNINQDSQRVRTPSLIKQEKAATCLDSAVLMAACFAQAGLEPVLVLTYGHAFAGYLTGAPLVFSDGSAFVGESAAIQILSNMPTVLTRNDDLGRIHQLLDEQHVQFVETTTTTLGSNRSFAESCLTQNNFNRNDDSELESVIFVSNAWRNGIRPPVSLADESMVVQGVVPLVDDLHQPGSGADGLFDSDVELIETDLSAADRAIPPRVRQWMASLLDLSGRNPLLKYKPSQCLEFDIPASSLGHIDDLLYTPKKRVSIVSPASLPKQWAFSGVTEGEFEQWLQGELKLVSPSFKRINEVHKNAENQLKIVRGAPGDPILGFGPDAVKSFEAVRADKSHPVHSMSDSTIINNVVASQLENFESELAKSINKVQTKAKEVMLMTGNNSMYLALGLMSWTQEPAVGFARSGRQAKPTSWSAPLFLYPVIVEGGRGAPYTVRLDPNGDVTPNYCLHEKLKRQPYNLDLRELVDPISDDKGIDLVKIIAAIRKRLKQAKLDNFAIEHRAILGVFDYSTFRLWKDLKDGWPKMAEVSPVARHLMYTSNSRYTLNPPTPSPQPEPHLPIAADDSQREAVQRALNGESFRLEGPPGTGKSQTIANLLASCIAHNKRILFVAEKQTALNAVKERLDAAGLGKYCLNLHAKGDSDTRLRKNINESLVSVLAERVEPEEQKWRDLAARVKNDEAVLDRYKEALHAVSVGGFSVWSAHEEALREGEGDLVSLPSGFVENYESNWEKLREIGFELDDALENVGDPTTHRWRFVEGVNVQESDLSPLANALQAVLNTFDHLMALGSPWSELIENPDPTRLRTLSSALQLHIDGTLPTSDTLRQLADDDAGNTVTSAWPKTVVERMRNIISKSRAISNDIGVHEGNVSSGVLTLFNYEQVVSLLEELDQATNGSALTEVVNAWNSFGSEIGRLPSHSLIPILENGNFDAINDAIEAFESKSEISSFDDFVMGCRFLVTQLSMHLSNVASTILDRNDILNVEFLMKEAKEAGFLSKSRKMKELREVLGGDALAKDDRLLLMSLEAVLPLATEATNLKHRLNTQFHGDYRNDFQPWNSSEIDSLIASFNSRRMNLLRDVVGVPALENDDARFIQTLKATVALSAGLAQCNECLSRNFPELIAEDFKPWVLGEVERLKTAVWDKKAQVIRQAASTCVLTLDDQEMVAGIRAWCSIKADAEELSNSLAGTVLPGYRKSFVPWDLKSIDELEQTFESIRHIALEIQASDQFSVLEELINGASDVSKVLLLVHAGDAWVTFQSLIDITPESIGRWLGGRTIGDAVLADFPAMIREGGDHNRFLQLIRWQSLRKSLERLDEVGLRSYETKILTNELTIEEMKSQVRRSAIQLALRMALEDGNLDRFDHKVHERRIRAFELALRDSQQMLKTRIPGLVNQRRASRALPTGNMLGGTQDLIRHLTPTRGERTPIRDLIERYGNSLADAMPCFLMSPDSVATLVPVGAIDFDLVVFDEASQVRTAHAVGALGRGTAAIVVGDSRQMPPSSAFSSNLGTVVEDDGGLDDDELFVDIEGLDEDVIRRPVANRDEESILAEFKSAEFPSMQLLCHYRSKDELLIAFSNTYIYPEPMLTFPSTLGLNSTALSFELVSDGFFQRDKKAPPHVFPNTKTSLSSLRTNRPEAERIVQFLLSRLRDSERQKKFEEDPDGSVESIIVVTFNVQQMNLINEMLRDEDLALYESATKEGPKDEVTDRARPPRLKIRNLESVQGDEAELVVFSVAFSKTVDGKFPLNFGPVTNPGGDRRLNVAVTRAQREMKVFASFIPSDMSQGGKILSDNARLVQRFLMLAQDGATKTAGVGINVTSSEQIEDIARHLRARGYVVQKQLGLSTLRVDLAVRRTDSVDWELAIMVDDVCWFDRGSAFQREVLPRQVLPGLGWKKMMRIWLPSWINDSDEMLEEIDNAFQEIDNGVSDNEELIAESELDLDLDLDSSSYSSTQSTENAPITIGLAGSSASRFSEFIPYDPDRRKHVNRLDEISYDRSAQNYVLDVVNGVLLIEGPVEQNRLAKSVARSMGLSRVSSARITEILQLIQRKNFSSDGIGTFVWPETIDQKTWNLYRTSIGAITRQPNEISTREYGNALVHIVEQVRSVSAEAAVRELAQVFGFQRVTTAVRDAIEIALKKAVRDKRVSLVNGEYLPPLSS